MRTGQNNFTHLSLNSPQQRTNMGLTSWVTASSVTLSLSFLDTASQEKEQEPEQKRRNETEVMLPMNSSPITMEVQRPENLHY